MKRSFLTSRYVNGLEKRILDVGGSLLLLIVCFPGLLIIALLIWITGGGPVLYQQKRVGKHRQVFEMYKFRTMYVGADKDQSKFQDLNESDGPVFKIKEDPRFIGIGRWLSRIGLDEIPQLWNVLKGDMSLVGPRPLPVAEHRRIPDMFRHRRELARPGIMSQWIYTGNHSVSFESWMKLDLNYLQTASMKEDVQIFFATVLMCITLIRHELVKKKQSI